MPKAEAGKARIVSSPSVEVVPRGLVADTTIRALLTAGIEIHCLRDLTRGGLAGALNEISKTSQFEIQIEEVERALKPFIHVPYMITKQTDEKFGEIVVLLVQFPDVAEVENICKRVLPKYWQPQKYRSVDEIPMTETGKVRRTFLYHQ